MTSQGTAPRRFTRAIQQRNLWAAEMSLRELDQPSLEDALAYLDLLAEFKPEKLERAAVRWHGRLETGSPWSSAVGARSSRGRVGDGDPAYRRGAAPRALDMKGSRWVPAWPGVAGEGATTPSPEVLAAR